MQNLALIQNQNGVSKPKHIRASMFGAQDVRFIAKDGYGTFEFDGKGEGETEIRMQIVGYVTINCEDFYLFNDDFEKYDRFLEVIFLDSENKLSTIFLKTESMGQFERTLRAIELDGHEYQSQIITAKAAKRDKPQKHFVLEFEHSGKADSKVTEELKTMLDPENTSPYIMAASRYLTGVVKKIPRNA